MAKQASSRGDIVHTIADVAARVGVNQRTVAKWCKAEGFPGRPGDQVKGRKGRFSISKIEAWRVARKKAFGQGSDQVQSAERAKLLNVKRRIVEIDLAERQGQVVDAEQMRRRILRCWNEAAAILKQLEPELLSSLPGQIPQAARKRARERIRKRVEQALASIARSVQDEAAAEREGSG